MIFLIVTRWFWWLPVLFVVSVLLTVTICHVARNREYWQSSAERYAEVAPRLWDGSPSWGQFGVPEREARLLPDVTGLDVVELGCGTGYVSAWLLRAGARSVVGLDNSAAQLSTARALQERHALQYPLLQADAEHVPLRAATFDNARFLAGEGADFGEVAEGKRADLVVVAGDPTARIEDLGRITHVILGGSPLERRAGR